MPLVANALLKEGRGRRKSTEKSGFVTPPCGGRRGRMRGGARVRMEIFGVCFRSGRTWRLLLPYRGRPGTAVKDRIRRVRGADNE